MKAINFLGDTLNKIRTFPMDAKRDTGYQLDCVQRGKNPTDYKPMNAVGVGVKEIRVKDENGIYRVIYIAKFADTVYVLNAFQKKTQKTPQREIDLAKQRLKDIKP